MEAEKSSRTTTAAFLLILGVAAGVRLWNLEWGLPFALMPDEARYMAMGAYLRSHAGWDPGRYKDSHLVTLQDLGCQIVVDGWARGRVERAPEPPSFSLLADPAPVYIASRLITVSLSVMTVVLLWRIGLRLSSAPSALFAAVLLGLHGLAVSQAKVAVPDTHLAFFSLAALGCCRWSVRSRRLLPVCLASFFVGLSAAAKFNGAFVGVAPLVALALFLRSVSLRSLAAAVAAAVACAALGYFLGNPFGVLHPKQLYIGIAYMFRISQHAHFWQEPGSAFAEYLSVLRPEIGLMAVLGGAVLWIRSSRDDRLALLPEVAFIVLFFAYMSVAPLHFPRFILPIVAPLCLYASLGCVALAEQLFAGRSARRCILIAACCLFAFRGAHEIVQRETRKARGDTQIQVSRWAEESLPEGAKVATEWNGIRTPGVADAEDIGLEGDQIRAALARFGGKEFRIDRLPWSVGEHPLAWYRERGIQWIVLNQEIRLRVFRDPTLDRMQKNYDEIEEECPRVARFEPRDAMGRPTDGPTMDVYRVTP